jgi:hypothetical protein
MEPEYVYIKVIVSLSYLVHEDDAWLVLAGIAEHLPDHTRTLADVLVHDRTRQHLFSFSGEREAERGESVVSQDVCPQNHTKPQLS